MSLKFPGDLERHHNDFIHCVAATWLTVWITAQIRRCRSVPSSCSAASCFKIKCLFYARVLAADSFVYFKSVLKLAICLLAMVML